VKRNFLLSLKFAKIYLKERYIGTGLGKLWYILSPLINIFIYTVIFSDFMKMKLNLEAIDSDYSYSIYLIPGILAWTSFNTIVMRLSTSILDKANLIKKISVPIYVYQLSILIVETFILFISFLIAILFLIAIGHPVTWSFLYLIPLLLLQSIFGFSLGVILSLFTPFFKDLKEAIPIIFQLWFWATPIIYLKDIIENKYPFILKYNPFYYFLDIYQNIFLYSKSPTLKSILIVVAITLSTFILAIYLYKKLVSAIKDII
jgi:lipopolysaccharide transport system permease protein